MARHPQGNPTVDPPQEAGRPVSSRAPGFWPWFLQRASGVLLVFLLAVHIWMGHFAGLGDVVAGRQGELVEFDIVRRRLAQALFLTVDFALLALVLYHGLNGMYTILLEWSVAARRRRAATAALWAVGVVAFIYGARALLAFVL